MANYTETILVRVTPEMKRELDAIAEGMEGKLSWLMRIVIRDWLKARKEKADSAAED